MGKKKSGGSGGDVAAKKKRKEEAEKEEEKEQEQEEKLELAINSAYDADKYKNTFGKHMKDANPFPHIQIPDFVDNSANALELLEGELQVFEWGRKENDLYSLYQTPDFKNFDEKKQPRLCAIRDFLYNDVRPWLEKVSGVKLTEQVDITGSCYAHTDGLLPHSDLIDTRRFAFVFYLTAEGWSESDGGFLNLYNSNDADEPTDVARRLCPERNSLLLFEVSRRSWHRVGEILCDDYPRLSINGWFHSERRLEPHPQKALVAERKSVEEGSYSDLVALIDEQYHGEEKHAQVEEFFGDRSEVMLNKFIKADVYSSLLDELKSLEFAPVGPPNKRHLSSAPVPSGASPLSRFSRLWSSSAGRQLMIQMTGCEIGDSDMSMQLFRVDAGCYSVAGDEDAEQAQRDGYCLDVHLFLGGGESEWAEDAGGAIIYVAQHDDEELIRVTPAANSLALVYKEPDVFSFLKYANSRVNEAYYLLTMSYYHVKQEEGEEEEEEEEESGAEDEEEQGEEEEE